MTSDVDGPVISVMLAVSDATEAAGWYARALGATELWNLGSVVGLTVAGAPFFLGEPENNRWDTPDVAGTRTVRIEVFVDDPDGFIDRAVAAGADASAEVDPRSPGAVGCAPSGQLRGPVRPPVAGRGQISPACPYVGGTQPAGP